MKTAIWALAAWLWAFGMAHAAPLTATPEEIAAFLKEDCPSLLEKTTCAFDAALRKEIKKRVSVAAAGKLVFASMNLSPVLAGRLANAYVIGQFEFEYDGEDREKRRALYMAHKARQRAAYEEYIAIAREGAYGQPILAFVVDVIVFDKGTDLDTCDVRKIDDLSRGAPDPTAIAIEAAKIVHCPEWDAFALKLRPDHPELLWQLSKFGFDDAGANLTLIDAILAQTPVVVGRAGNERPLGIVKEQLMLLLEAGQAEAAIAAYEALGPARRSDLFTFDKGEETARVSGMNFPVARPSEDEIAQMQTGLAAAYAATGREKIGRAMLAQVKSSQQWRDLFWKKSDAGDLDIDWRNTADRPLAEGWVLNWLMLDAVLNPGKRDLYPLMEFGYAATNHGAPVLKRTIFRYMRQKLMGGALEFLRERESRVASRYVSKDVATLEAFVRGSPYAAAYRAWNDKIAAADRELGLTPRDILDSSDRKSVIPDTPGERRFKAVKRATIAATLKPLDAASAPKAVKGPEGYGVVRMERAGARVVAITVSQALDPTGEVSEGGYFVHLSEDGGKTWGPALYTGLAVRFPYEISGEPQWRMIDGNRLRVEAAVRLVDTASIFFPPVAMRLAREEKDLILEMPLAVLSADQDGDGLTDIEEEKLLLDPANPDSDGDGARDGRDPMPNVSAKAGGPANPNLPVIAAVLAEIMGKPMGAIIMGVDPQGDPFKDAMGEAREQITRDKPLLIEGNKADFAGLRPRAMTLVYSDAEIERLEKTAPVFLPLRIGPMLMNAEGSRGFVVWSMRWTGGTFRVIRTPKGLELKPLRQWIT